MHRDRSSTMWVSSNSVTFVAITFALIGILLTDAVVAAIDTANGRPSLLRSHDQHQPNRRELRKGDEVNDVSRSDSGKRSRRVGSVKMAYNSAKA